MRTITTTLADLNKAALALSGKTIPELVNLYSSPPPPKKHDSHVACQFVGEWMNGCNAHIEAYNDFIETSGYDGIVRINEPADIW